MKIPPGSGVIAGVEQGVDVCLPLREGIIEKANLRVNNINFSTLDVSGSDA
jgi:hypothetical protein